MSISLIISASKIYLFTIGTLDSYEVMFIYDLYAVDMQLYLFDWYVVVVIFYHNCGYGLEPTVIFLRVLLWRGVLLLLGGFLDLFNSR